MSRSKLVYIWPRNAKTSETFSKTMEFGGRTYQQSPVNPDYVTQCTPTGAKNRAEQLRKEGWAARVVRFGPAYVVYERRTGREMRSKRGHKVLGI